MTTTEKKQLGIVRVWHADKGWGFIRLMERLPDGRCRPINDRGVPDTFVHVSQVRKAGLLTLNQHDVVRFEKGIDDRAGKPWAINVELAA
jgi:cold shock CspA family protein